MFWSLIRARMFFPASGRGAKRQLLLPLGAVERFAGEGISLIVGYDEPALALRFFGSWLDGPDSDRAGMRLQRCIVGMHCKPFQISSGRKDDPRRALAGGLKHILRSGPKDAGRLPAIRKEGRGRIDRKSTRLNSSH